MRARVKVRLGLLERTVSTGKDEKMVQMQEERLERSVRHRKPKDNRRCQMADLKYRMLRRNIENKGNVRSALI